MLSPPNEQNERRGRVAARALWGPVGQVFSSVSNAGLGVAVAQSATPEAFGWFALSLGIYFGTVQLLHGATTAPLTMKYAVGHRSSLRAQLPACITITVAASILISLLVSVTIMLLLEERDRTFFTVIALTLPGLALQAFWRLAAFAERLPRRAAIIDGCWLALQGIGFAICFTVDATATWFMVSWSVAGAFTGISCCVVFRVKPAGRRRTTLFVREQRAILPSLLSEQGLLAVTAQGVPYLLAVLVGVTAVGAIKAAQLVLGLLNVVLLGLTPILFVEAVRMHAVNPSRLSKLMAVRAALGTGAIVGYAGILLVTPDRYGSALLGEVWRPAQTFVAALAAGMVMQWVAGSAFMALRARGDVAASLLLRLILSGAVVIGVIVGASMGGPHGAAWGMAGGAAVGAVTAWFRLLLLGSPSCASTPAERV